MFVEFLIGVLELTLTYFIKLSLVEYKTQIVHKFIYYVLFVLRIIEK